MLIIFTVGSLYMYMSHLILFWKQQGIKILILKLFIQNLININSWNSAVPWSGWFEQMGSYTAPPQEVPSKRKTSRSDYYWRLTWCNVLTRVFTVFSRLLLQAKAVYAITNTSFCAWINALNQRERLIQKHNDGATWFYKILWFMGFVQLVGSWTRWRGLDQYCRFVSFHCLESTENCHN